MRDKENRAIVSVILAALALLTACRSGSVPSVGQVETGTPQESPATRPMRRVTDDLERTVLLPTKITRVISTAPSVTEMIFAAGGGDRLVGVTTFCNYPEEAKSIAKIGDTMTPNIETIIALKPDVVFVSTASQIEAFMTTLEANGIAVYVLNPTYLEDVFENLRELGIIFDTIEPTQKLAWSLEERVLNADEPQDYDETDAQYKGRVKPVTVFVQISKEPLFTVGKSSFLRELIRRAGGKLVTDNIETAFPKLSKETALALQPEVIFLSASDDNREPNEVFKNSPAVKNGRVYSIDADLLSRPGPRLVDALEQIAKYLHPEKFK